MELSRNIETTIKAVASSFVVLGVGGLLVRFGVLDQSGVTGLSKLVNGFFLPIALFARLGGTLSNEVWGQTWTLPLVGLVPVILSLLVGTVVVRLSGMAVWLRPWILIAFAFPNNLALPLVFLTSTCREVEFSASMGLKTSFDAEGNESSDNAYLTESECMNSGELYIFMANLLSTFMFWLFAYDLAVFLTAPFENKLCNFVNDAGTGVSSSTMPEPSTHSLHDEEAVHSIDDDIERTREADLEEAADVRQKDPNWFKKMLRSKGRQVVSIWSNPPTSAQLVAILVALFPALQSFLFSPASAFSPVMGGLTIFSQALVPALNLVLSGSLGLKICSMKSIFRPDLESVGMNVRTVVLIVVTRMVVLPLVSFGALYALREWAVLPQNNSLWNLVLYFTVLTPTSNGTVVLAQLSGNTQAGQAIALVILFQYIAGVFTMSVFVFLSYSISL